ncbi:fasciclin domain-containing protein [Phycicoccus sp. MAQZ13P-2]|uniref:fasciclin domain-containing protein n=1 Tax=Phycicoccus mangrovi TaxID=2840470 RepID=UPI001BFFFCEE|nr:fasciclin domain-containing protein [Phycicoccus mangrovi]MBT9254265.1 fasciclin domain-containing protein [Phycicoccus mangrovi]MBT9272643.1 fasciclin domain-containing protein [Phycicoccus mangrovi]
MRTRRLVTAAVAVALGATTLAAAPASASSGSSAPTGTRSLAAVLTSDGNTFDRNWYDYDIVTEAVLAVLAAKPDSPVKVLADGRTPVTAFLPDDRSFQVLAYDLTKRWPSTEKKTFDALVAAVGVDAIEQVLLYHVVPGATIAKRDAVKADGAALTTAQGGTITVKVRNKWIPLVELKDQDRNDVNPFVNPRRFDINKGNKQIAHGIVFVLRPLDL